MHSSSYTDRISVKFLQQYANQILNNFSLYHPCRKRHLLGEIISTSNIRPEHC